MFVRIWSTEVNNDRFEEYESFANRYSLPMFQKQDGCLGVLFLKGSANCKVVTFWRDQKAIDGLNNTESYNETVKAIM
ncbi:MAG: hypothetical protein O7D91_11875, partial [Planctomycetota bacterium]|nr:hypothetical protein [Planctomycetota bacterium]